MMPCFNEGMVVIHLVLFLSPAVFRLPRGSMSSRSFRGGQPGHSKSGLGFRVSHLARRGVGSCCPPRMDRVSVTRLCRFFQGRQTMPIKMDEGTLLAVLNAAATQADATLARITWDLLARESGHLHS